jgi:hypothetical protein
MRETRAQSLLRRACGAAPVSQPANLTGNPPSERFGAWKKWRRILTLRGFLDAHVALLLETYLAM